MSVDYGRQTFGLKNVSSDVKYNSESEQLSNLRGRHTRRSKSFSTNGALSDEPPTSTNSVSIHEEDSKKGSILSLASQANEESVREEDPSDLMDEKSSQRFKVELASGTETKISLSSHDAMTGSNDDGFMSNLSEQVPLSSTDSKRDTETDEITIIFKQESEGGRDSP